MAGPGRKGVWAWGGRCRARGGEVVWASEGRCRAGGGRAREGRSKDTGGVRAAGTPGPQWTVLLALGNKPHERASLPLTAPFRPLCPAEAPRELAGGPDRGRWVALRRQDSAWTQAPAVASWLSTAGQVTSSPSVFSQAPGWYSADRGQVSTRTREMLPGQLTPRVSGMRCCSLLLRKQNVVPVLQGLRPGGHPRLEGQMLCGLTRAGLRPKGPEAG